MFSFGCWFSLQYSIFAPTLILQAFYSDSFRHYLGVSHNSNAPWENVHWTLFLWPPPPPIDNVQKISIFPKVEYTECIFFLLLQCMQSHIPCFTIVFRSYEIYADLCYLVSVFLLAILILVSICVELAEQISKSCFKRFSLIEIWKIRLQPPFCHS